MLRSIISCLAPCGWTLFCVIVLVFGLSIINRRIHFDILPADYHLYTGAQKKEYWSTSRQRAKERLKLIFAVPVICVAGFILAFVFSSVKVVPAHASEDTATLTPAGTEAEITVMNNEEPVVRPLTTSNTPLPTGPGGTPADTPTLQPTVTPRIVYQDRVAVQTIIVQRDRILPVVITQVVTALPGPTQTPWIIVVTATPAFTPTPTMTPTETPTEIFIP